ncbi:unnamed protein product [Rotaria sp. Silwood1]|nr:unnamed protein product [Rotaria sp. Silwood1]
MHHPAPCGCHIPGARSTLSSSSNPKLRETGMVANERAVFQIDSCQYNVEEDLWHVQVHATDQDADLAAKYMEY